ncbi:MAG: cation transport regulator ChaB [Chloroflexi bacterium]|jgi:cation transport regulator|nr:cation transport regulator ChaB [Chloroflexota bacterium]
MRYEKIEDLPESLRNDLPDEAQEIYLEAYQKSWDSFKEEMGGDLGQEAVAHRDAMHAVKQEFVEDKEKGLWYRKGEEPEEEEEDEGLLSDLADAL